MSLHHRIEPMSQWRGQPSSGVARPDTESDEDIRIPKYIRQVQTTDLRYPRLAELSI